MMILVQCRLLAFRHTDFHIDGVSGHVQFDRLDIEEEITVVPIELGDIHIALFPPPWSLFSMVTTSYGSPL